MKSKILLLSALFGILTPCLGSRPLEASPTVNNVSLRNIESSSIEGETHDIDGLGALNVHPTGIRMLYNQNTHTKIEMNSYLLANNATIIDLNFTDSSATKGGTLELSEGSFEKIVVGKNRKGEIQIRIFTKAELGDIRNSIALVNDNKGFSLRHGDLIPVSVVAGEIPPEESKAEGLQNELQPDKVATNSSASNEITISTAPIETAQDKTDITGESVPNVTETDQPSENHFEGYKNPLWQGITLAVLCLAVIGLVGSILIKYKGKSLIFGQGKHDKQMEVISTLPIAPKRQILLVKIKGQEFAVASTENGIQFLTNISNNTYTDKPIIQTRIMPEESKPTQIESKQYNDELKKQSSKTKSDALLESLKQLKNRKQSTTDEATQTNSTLQKTKFPKYLANAFEQEAKRTPNVSENQNDDQQADVESVTKMIRERLRSANSMI